MRVIFLSLLISFLSACAASNVSRDVASNIDQGVQHTTNVVNDMSEGDLADSYQNSSQTAKGVVLGGAAGAITGAFVPAVGVIPGTAVGAIFGGSYGAYIDSNTTIEDQLANRGATIVILGDQMLIVLSSARIFQDATAVIKPQAYSTLHLVANYINGFTKMLVKVTAYTNDIGPRQADLALSQQQAENVAKFLNATGLDSRLLYAVGCGGTHLIVPRTATTESDNNRIEITLEKLYL